MAPWLNVRVSTERAQTVRDMRTFFDDDANRLLSTSGGPRGSSYKFDVAAFAAAAWSREEGRHERRRAELGSCRLRLGHLVGCRGDRCSL